MDLVSIVVPVYNVDRYLDRCIVSLVNQDYCNIEIILVDDGSTDDSGKKCDYYSTLYDNIRVIHQNNMGLSGARNTGTENSKGKFVAYVDSDDWVSIDYISYQMRLVEEYKADIVATKQVSVWKENGKYLQKFKEIVEVYAKEKAVEQMCYGYKFGASACKLIRIEIAKKYLFPVGMLYEDLAIMYKMLSDSRCVVYSNQAKYFYRRRVTSIINQKFNQKHLCILDHTRELRNFIIDKYPNINEAGIYKSAYVITQIMPMVLYAKEKQIFINLKKEMRRYYWKVIFNNKVKIKYKVRCSAIMGGYYIAKSEVLFEENIKRIAGKRMSE